MKGLPLHRLAIVLLLSGFLPFLQAQESTEKSLLWEVSGNGLEQASYIFGTIHVIPSGDFIVFPQADAKLQKSDRLVLEMVVDVPLATQIEWSKQMLLPEGGNLRNLIPEDRFLDMQSYVVDTLGVKANKFNTYLILKPFFLYTALIPEIMGEKLESYELHFTKQARSNKKEIIGLETFEYQLSIFDTIPLEKQVDMLFGEKVDMKTDFESIIAMFKDQDIDRMAMQMEEENDDFPEITDKLLTGRNKEWVGKLTVLMAEKPSFIAVGAGHLGGKTGLIALLREMGYTLRPLTLEEN